MRNKDILLVVLFVVLVLGIAFGPGLVERWRTRDAARQPVPEASVDITEGEVERPALSPEQQQEAERVSGMLMLHRACVERIEGFEDPSQDVATAWEQRYGELLAAQPEQDFRIVLAQPEGLDEAAVEKARAEERGLCERNLDAMRAKLAEDGERQP